MRNAFDLVGRRILITGAAVGIGAATAHVCAALGAELVLVDINDSGPVAEAVHREGGRAKAITADASSRAEIEGIAADNAPIDALVLNAAICPWDDDWYAPEWDDSFERVMAVNVLGPIHAARA